MASPLPMALPALLALLLMLAPLAARAQATAGAVSEYAVKSALLFKLPRFVYLPRLGGGTQITLCVLGKNPFGGALDRLAQTPIDGRRVQVLMHDKASQTLDCDFVFVARSEAAQLRATLTQLEEAPVVTVSDIEGFARAGGGIRASVSALRNASEDALLRQSLPRAQALLHDGATKVFQGLTTAEEILRVARQND